MFFARILCIAFGLWLSSGNLLHAQPFTLVPEKPTIYLQQNLLHLKGGTSSCKSLELATNNGSIIRKGCDVYLTPEREGYAFVKLYQRVQGKRRKLGAYMYRVERMPALALVGTLSGGTASKKLILAMGGMRAFLQTAECWPLMPVTSFKVMASRNDTCMGAATNIGYPFTETTTALIHRLSAGDNLVFYEIKAVLNQQDTIRLPALEFVIKE